MKSLLIFTVIAAVSIVVAYYAIIEKNFDDDYLAITHSDEETDI